MNEQKRANSLHCFCWLLLLLLFGCIKFGETSFCFCNSVFAVLVLFYLVYAKRKTIYPTFTSTQLPSLNLNVSFFDTSIDWRKFTRLIKFIYIENVFWKWYGKYCSHSHHLWRITLRTYSQSIYSDSDMLLVRSHSHSTSSLFYVSVSALF